MPSNDKAVVLDLNKKPIPQYFNESLDQYEASKGDYGAPYFHEKGTIVKEMWVGTSGETKTFDEPVQGLYIKNDSPNTLTITIHGHSMELYEDEWIDEKFKPFTELIISAAGQFRAIVRI